MKNELRKQIASLQSESTWDEGKKIILTKDNPNHEAIYFFKSLKFDLISGSAEYELTKDINEAGRFNRETSHVIYHHLSIFSPILYFSLHPVNS